VGIRSHQKDQSDKSWDAAVQNRRADCCQRFGSSKASIVVVAVVAVANADVTVAAAGIVVAAVCWEKGGSDVGWVIDAETDWDDDDDGGDDVDGQIPEVHEAKHIHL